MGHTRSQAQVSQSSKSTNPVVKPPGPIARTTSNEMRRKSSNDGLDRSGKPGGDRPDVGLKGPITDYKTNSPVQNFDRLGKTSGDCSECDLNRLAEASGDRSGRNAEDNDKSQNPGNVQAEEPEIQKGSPPLDNTLSSSAEINKQLSKELSDDEPEASKETPPPGKPNQPDEEGWTKTKSGHRSGTEKGVTPRIASPNPFAQLAITDDANIEEMAVDDGKENDVTPTGGEVLSRV